MVERECKWVKYTYDNLHVEGTEPYFTLKSSCWPSDEYEAHLVQMRNPKKCKCGKPIKFVGWNP